MFLIILLPFLVLALIAGLELLLLLLVLPFAALARIALGRHWTIEARHGFTIWWEAEAGSWQASGVRIHDVAAAIERGDPPPRTVGAAARATETTGTLRQPTPVGAGVGTMGCDVGDLGCWRGLPAPAQWILDAVPDGLLMIEDDARITYANPVMAALFGATPEEMVQFTVFDALGEDGVEEFRKHLAIRGSVAEDGRDRAYRINRPDGSEMWILVRHSPIHDADGVLQGWLTASPTTASSAS